MRRKRSRRPRREPNRKVAALNKRPINQPICFGGPRLLLGHFWRTVCPSASSRKRRRDDEVKGPSVQALLKELEEEGAGGFGF